MILNYSNLNIIYTQNLQYSSRMAFLTFLLDTIHRLIHTVTYEQTQPFQTETKSRPGYGVEGGTPEAQGRRTEGTPSQRASPSRRRPFGIVRCRCPVLGCRHGASLAPRLREVWNGIVGFGRVSGA